MKTKKKLDYYLVIKSIMSNDRNYYASTGHHPAWESKKKLSSK
jgi:hypothetical protein